MLARNSVPAFDLIIFDEAHRSIFKRFAEVIEYFDARMIGLTATPANFVDRDTFRVFNCDANTPTFLYEYQQAVQESSSWTQPVSGADRISAQGIKGVDLNEEDRNALIEQGIDPHRITPGLRRQIEVEVSNTDAPQAVGGNHGGLPQKTNPASFPARPSMFAMTKKTPERVRGVREMYPPDVGVAQVITSTTEGMATWRRRRPHPSSKERPAASRHFCGHARGCALKW